MNKSSLFLILAFMSSTLCAQKTEKDDKKKSKIDSHWFFKTGVNLVDSKYPELKNNAVIFEAFTDFKTNAFGAIPAKVSIEGKFNRFLGLEIGGSFNRWAANEGVIKGVTVTEDKDYIAVDASLKFYLDGLFNGPLKLKMDWLDLYFSGGIGNFYVDETVYTINYGIGTTVWVSNTIGLNFDYVAKTVLGPKNEIPFYTASHYQYSTGLVFKLDPKNNSKTLPDSRLDLEKLRDFLGPDSDNDGIFDKEDKCPNIKGTSNNNGCPFPDSDADGVLDKVDKCPNIKGASNNEGCPFPDTDGDGILDKVDECPNVFGSFINNGCPIDHNAVNPNDTNGDSSKNSSSDTSNNGGNSALNGTNNGGENGSSSNENQNSENTGSNLLDPMTREEITNEVNITTLANRIKFKPGNYNFTQETYPILIRLTEVLMAYPQEVDFTLIGHTDNLENPDFNTALSKTRANAVRNYFIDRGISQDRISTLGKGETDPIATNDNEEGREANRRIVILAEGSTISKEEIVENLKNTETQEPQTVELTKLIQFDFERDDLKNSSFEALDTIADILKSYPTTTKFMIVGHTNSVGSYISNRVLSIARANAVRGYLVDKGVSKNQLDYSGLGEVEPIASNLTKKGRTVNNRIEIYIVEPVVHFK